MSIRTVDEFVEARVLPEHREIVALLRELMRECAPHAKEEVRYGVPVWTGRRGLAVISPTKKDITFAFSRGAEFTDPYGLLQGVGKVSKRQDQERPRRKQRRASLLHRPGARTRREMSPDSVIR